MDQASPRSLRIAFEEVQRFRQRWVLLVVVIVAGLAWTGFIMQIVLGQSLGTRPAPDSLIYMILAVAGVGFPLFILGSSMRTRVDDVLLAIRFRPFAHRRIPLDTIVSAESKTYRPLLDYGGWGVRRGWDGWCYNVSGNRGVLIVLANGKRVMIGSQRADELARAIGRRLRSAQASSVFDDAPSH